MGIHQQSPCHVAGHGGYQVEVGPWRLIHFTDPTTCHCLISNIRNETDLHNILAIIAPAFPAAHGNGANNNHSSVPLDTQEVESPLYNLNETIPEPVDEYTLSGDKK